MGWLPGAKQARPRLEEATDLDGLLSLVKDMWVKLRTIQTHGAGLLGLVSTMNTEQAHHRYGLERVAAEVAGMRAEMAERYEEVRPIVDAARAELAEAAREKVASEEG